MFPFDNNSSAENPPPNESLLLKRSSSSSSHFHSHPDHDHHLQNPNPPPFFSNFPSPFFDEHELPLHQMLVAAPSIDIPETSHKRGLAKTGKRKRTAGKKDRHSKICTAHGIRDRRMRLSLPVARKFFDIQDMLGYDKASATIEWLFSKSKQAIKELVAAKRQTNNAHFTFDFSDSLSSECEVMSGVAHEVMSSEKNALGQVLAKKKSRKINRGRPYDSVRESREKARARARWRTREKMMFKRHVSGSSLGWANCVSSLQSHHHDLDQKLGFSIDQEFTENYHTAASLLLSQDRDAGTIEKLLGNSSLSSASNLSPISDNNNNNNNNDNYQCCIDPSSSNLMGFMGDWEMLSNVTNQQVSSVAGNNSNDNSVITTHNFPLFPQ